MQVDTPTRPRVAVMTMGALHPGHAALMDRARAQAGTGGELVVSIFVNPLQFGAGEDFDRYPRTWDQDVALCAAHGVDTIFAPVAADLYAGTADVSIDPGPLGAILEGAARPGHFRGVLTVVAKLLNIMAPDSAVFGEKDYQQLVLIRHMVAALNIPVRVIGAPTVREPDGLARSSRNAYLSADERRSAAVIPRATAAARSAAELGADAQTIVTLTWDTLREEPGVEPDYAVVTDPELGPAPDTGDARLLVAARIGSPRLLDNVPLVLGPR